MRGARSLPGQALALGPGPEFDRIRRIVNALGAEGTGLGDDCGLFREGDTYIAASTDVSVEGVHFRRDWISAEEAGYRSAAAALSDLAAEGAEPVGILCAVTLPAATSEEELVQLMAGAGSAARAVGASVLGGDLSAGSILSIAVTVLGRAQAPVTRSGAAAGDGVWVTGQLGGARAALEPWLRGAEPLPGARQRFVHPEPRIAAGRWLARQGARAMLDLSDGLGGDARHLAAASEVALEIDLDSIPLAPEVAAEARRLGITPQQFAAEGGEDYELLVALPAGFSTPQALVQHCGVPLVRIGSVARGTGVRFRLSGRDLELRGFNHFG